MLAPWISPRLHGWLDEVATLTYLAAALALHYQGLALGLLVAAAGVHFVNTRVTNYPEGQFKLYSLNVHARVELAEGLGLASAFLVVRGVSTAQQAAGIVLGLLQVGAALFADLRWPRPLVEQ